MLTRRDFLKASAAAAGLAATHPWQALAASAGTVTAALPDPATAPFDHVIVLMMENRSFDHFLGWLPGADGRQAGLAFTDKAGTTYPTYDLAPDFQGCGFEDPDHSWEGGLKQLSGGSMAGFLQTPTNPGDTFPIGFYTEASLPVLGALARNYTVSDNYFCSILAETYPNRFYQHAARTYADHNGDATSAGFTTMPAIWDLLATAGLTGRYYSTDLPFTALWGPKFASITKPFAQFAVDCAAGQLANVTFVDPEFVDEGSGFSRDDHPHADVRAGEAFIGEVYDIVRHHNPHWDRTVFIINYDEWGGFYDHVRPPVVVDDTVEAEASKGKAHPNYGQLGFRVPNVVISPFAPAGRVVSGGAPFDHTSVLKMIEWRFGLPALTARDANARNLAEMLDFSTPRTDDPAIPQGIAGIASVPCGPTSVAARRPDPISGPGGSGGSGGSGSGSGSGGATAAPGGALPRTGTDTRPLFLAGVAAMGAALAVRHITKDPTADPTAAMYRSDLPESVFCPVTQASSTAAGPDSTRPITVNPASDTSPATSPGSTEASSPPEVCGS
ncbi:MAG: phospholipase [Acidimicrobiaceae bacterium]|nr:phospholipase [Acidimicrobiaceae bacterium]